MSNREQLTTCVNRPSTVGQVRRDHCDCGHERAAHMHYRSGSDCAICPPGECLRYNGPKRPWWSFFSWRPDADASDRNIRTVRPDDDDDDRYASGGSALTAAGAALC